MADSSPSELHDQLWHQLQTTFLHCLSYMGNPSRETGKKPGITLGWSGADRLMGARDGLQYRNHALVWHLSLLNNYKKHFECEIEKVIFDSQKEFETRRNTQQKLGFILDDVVFNAMSVFDYTAEYVFATHLPDHRGNKTWFKLSQNISKIEDTNLADIIQDAHSEFIKHLERYRGHVIHNKPEVGGIGYTHELVTRKVEHDISLPEKLISQLPIFTDADSKIQIDAGAERIVKRTLEIELDIVNQLGAYEYNPRRSSIFEDSKFT